MTSLVLNQIAEVEPWLAIRTAFLAASMIILLVNAIPSLRIRLLSYGSRLTLSENPSKPSTVHSPVTISGFLDRIAAYRVPHSYFIHFYVVSVIGSLVWAHQILSRGPLLEFLAARTSHTASTMTPEQVALVWILMFIQGSRRLYECLIFSKPSRSEMWIGHWIMGLLFYAGMPIAIWIEGMPRLRDGVSWNSPQMHKIVSPGDMVAMLPAPSIRTITFTTLFLLASGLQYDTHSYLYSLPKPSNATAKYTRPTHPNFSLSLTPHYFFEVLVYVSLAFISAPTGELINGTVLCGLLFVTVNLGITAQGTEVFWKQTWGDSSTQGRARMIPRVW